MSNRPVTRTPLVDLPRPYALVETGDRLSQCVSLSLDTNLGV